ncbi:MAG: thiamine diphosphokinase [Burkholderiales bacterium]|nr:thiamine diphosphokinase [Burkholderiales bacterium]
MNNILQHLLPSSPSRIAIVANGEFPSQNAVIEHLTDSNLIIACDGAINQLASNNILADYVIGDGDSSSIDKIQLFAKNPYIKTPDQNSNDLSKAVNFLEQTFGTQHEVIIYAATGLREDHALANIALLLQYAQRFKNIHLLSDHGIFTVCHSGTQILASSAGQQISFFSLEQAQNNFLSCQELKWPLINLRLEYLNSGTLNQALGEQLTISCNHPMLIFRAFETKSN